MDTPTSKVKADRWTAARELVEQQIDLARELPDDNPMFIVIDLDRVSATIINCAFERGYTIAYTMPATDNYCAALVFELTQVYVLTGKAEKSSALPHHA